jgi:phosphohistidine phosphatase
MALTLVLVRHAKSSWSNPNLKDFERPLNDRGNRDAPVMAERTRSLELKPTIISSGATRALTTAKVFASVLGIPEESIQVSNDLYLASSEQILHFVNQLDTHPEVMIFGHNPGMTDAVNMLTKSRIDNVPTCGVAVLRFPVDRWSEVTAGSGALVSFDYPKNQSGR